MARTGAGSKLARIWKLFLKPGDFFEEVARDGQYFDGVLFTLVLSIWIAAGVIIQTDSLKDSAWPIFFGRTAGSVFTVLLFLTAIWGLLCGLLGQKLRKRIAIAMSTKEAILRCIRVLMYATWPLAVLFVFNNTTMGVAALGLLLVSSVAISKAFLMKVAKQLLACGVITCGISYIFLTALFEVEQGGIAKSVPPNQLLVGKMAPNILIKPTDGEPLHLADLKGKVVILDFWATWCPPCRKGLPMVNEVVAKFKDQTVFYAIANENAAEEKKFLLDNKIDNAIASGTDREGIEAFGVSAIPETVVIDKAGKVKSVHIGLGANEKNELIHEVEESLKVAK